MDRQNLSRLEFIRKASQSENPHPVAGYGGVSLTVKDNWKPGEFSSDPSSTGQAFTLRDSHKIMLLKFARKIIRRFLTNQSAPLVRNFDPALERKQGAFVTLRKDGGLRGCIGHLGENQPLCEVVGSMALQAAFNDPRFSPLTKDELPQIEIGISVLTPYQSIESADEIEIGRDGVIIKKKDRQAVFLPQVAGEREWDRKQLLEHLCLKAGLPPGSWKKDARLFIFQAQTFCESEFV